jgi:hypothetical protein
MKSYFALSKPHNIFKNVFPNIFFKFILIFSLSVNGKNSNQEYSKGMLAFNQLSYYNNKKIFG